MKIDNLKDLKALVALCRKAGIARIEVDGVKLELEDLPVQTSPRNEASPSNDKIDTGKQYTEEELMTWSSAPLGGEVGNG